VATGSDKTLMAFDPQTSAACHGCPQTFSFPKNKDSVLRRISVNHPNGGQIVVRPIANLRE
jgi:hypothetical protein